LALLAPIKKRVRFIRFWENHWNIYKKFNYILLSTSDFNVGRYISLFFNAMPISKSNLLLSHFTFIRSYNSVLIYVFLHDPAKELLSASMVNLRKKGKKEDSFSLSKILSKLYWKKLFLKVTFVTLFFCYLIRISLNVVKKIYEFIISHPSFINIILYFCFSWLHFSNKVFNPSPSSLITFNNQLNYKAFRFFSIRSEIYKNRYFLIFKEKEAFLEVLQRPHGTNLLKYGISLFNIYSLFIKQLKFFVKFSTLRFVYVRNSTITASLLCFLVAQKIRLFARPTSRKSKLNSLLFRSIFRLISNDKTVLGFKILLTGRINRRGRAMWRTFLYKRVPVNIFHIPVDFCSLSLKTANGILTIKTFLFRYSNKQNTLKYFDFVSLPFFLFKRKEFFVSRLHLMKEEIEEHFLDNKASVKRKIKKLKRGLLKRTGYSLV
jgi:hypothetical protein